MTYSKKYNWRSFCKDSLDQIENYPQALADNFKGWCIHHRLEIQPDGTRVSRQELKDNGLYYGRPANELVFMRFGDHITLHNLGNHHSAETRQKIAEALSGENNPFFGKHHSEDTRRKMSESLSCEKNPFFGKHLPTETRQKMSESHKGKRHSEYTRQKMSMSLKGFYKGTRWWNNGISNKRSRECPGEGWTRGRLRFK